jgi:hypothetical protein
MVIDSTVDQQQSLEQEEIYLPMSIHNFQHLRVLIIPIVTMEEVGGLKLMALAITACSLVSIPHQVHS